MARVTKHGCRSANPSDNLPWWDGAETQCGQCGCHFVFVCGEDFEDVETYVHPACGPCATLPCPECGDPSTVTTAHVRESRARMTISDAITRDVESLFGEKEASPKPKRKPRKAAALTFDPVNEKQLRARLLGSDKKTIRVDSVESAGPLPVIENLEEARVNAIRQATQEINAAHNARVREILEERDRQVYGDGTKATDSDNSL